VVLTFQALGQMQHRYGPKIAEAMLGCCNTKLFLQTIDSETREWASATIGECEVEIQTMTDALADGDDKPRTTLGKIRKMRPAILESELRLPKFEGYLLFPDGLPVARIRLTADHIDAARSARQPGLCPGDVKATHWNQPRRPRQRLCRSRSHRPPARGQSDGCVTIRARPVRVRPPAIMSPLANIMPTAASPHRMAGQGREGVGPLRRC
jgi:hypothetical protein